MSEHPIVPINGLPDEPKIDYDAIAAQTLAAYEAVIVDNLTVPPWLKAWYEAHEIPQPKRKGIRQRVAQWWEDRKYNRRCGCDQGHYCEEDW